MELMLHLTLEYLHTQQALDGEVEQAYQQEGSSQQKQFGV